MAWRTVVFPLKKDVKRWDISRNLIQYPGVYVKTINHDKLLAIVSVASGIAKKAYIEGYWGFYWTKIFRCNMTRVINIFGFGLEKKILNLAKYLQKSCFVH